MDSPDASVLKPYRLEHSGWVSNTRLACVIYGILMDPSYGPVALSRMMAVDSDGKNPRIVSTRQNPYSRGFQSLLVRSKCQYRSVQAHGGVSGGSR